MTRPRLATVWLGGCSGCHMSLLDTDEWLFELAAAADLVYSPIVDVKEFPHDVDVCLVEGAVANEDNLEFGLTGCRRRVPHLQRLLAHLEASLVELEVAVGLSNGKPKRRAAARKPT